MSTRLLYKVTKLRSDSRCGKEASPKIQITIAPWAGNSELLMEYDAEAVQKPLVIFLELWSERLSSLETFLVDTVTTTVNDSKSVAPSKFRTSQCSQLVVIVA